jgi:uncharacterized protein DUF5715
MPASPAATFHRHALIPLLVAVAIGACSPGDRVPEAGQTRAQPSVAVTNPPRPPAQPVSALPSPGASPVPLTGYDVPGWAEAVAAVEEKRGSNQRLVVPAALMHGADRRVFLATQLADATETRVHTPHDLADVAAMLRSGELVEVPPLSEDHLLYDVGADVHVDPLSHYDPGTNDVTPLPSASEEYQAVTALAADYGGHSYDLTQPSDSTRFQARLLSSLRPEARDVLDELARAYHERFGRRLPVSSLVRTLQYQRRLSRVNPNASRLELSPHTTGLAFDVLYKFMPNDEQDFVMQEIARLEQEGRVEALRERRNCFHVYVFESRQRPAGTLVASFFDEVEAAHPGSAPGATVSRPRAGARARTAAVRRGGAKRRASAAARTRKARRPPR